MTFSNHVISCYYCGAVNLHWFQNQIKGSNIWYWQLYNKDGTPHYCLFNFGEKYNKTCMWCGKAELKWQHTDKYGWRLFDKECKIHNCDKYKSSK